MLQADGAELTSYKHTVTEGDTMDALHFEYMPTLRQPYLLMTYGGWSDAAEVATAAGQFLVQHLQAERFETRTGRFWDPGLPLRFRFHAVWHRVERGSGRRPPFRSSQLD